MTSEEDRFTKNEVWIDKHWRNSTNSKYQLFHTPLILKVRLCFLQILCSHSLPSSTLLSVSLAQLRGGWREEREMEGGGERKKDCESKHNSIAHTDVSIIVYRYTCTCMWVS